MSFKERYRYDPNGELAEPLQGRSDSESKPRIQQPVKLQPSWEETNLPEDELNFKNLTMDEASLQLNTPQDRYYVVYTTFLIHGIGTLMSWNMFITAFEYFLNFKLGANYIGFDFPHNANFMQYLTFCSQIPNVLFNWINIFVHIGGDLTTRIIWSITINILIFIVTIILAMAETKELAYGFFYITMITVVILNMSNGVYQNTVYGMAAKLPPKYTGAVILGNNICGTFATLVSMMSKAVTDDKRMAAIYYFITALFVLLVCFDTYFALPLSRFYRHFELREKKLIEQRRKVTSGVPEKTPYWEIIKKAWPQLYNVFIIFVVTLAIFPAIGTNVQAVSANFPISKKFFVDITCFLTFNVFAMIGSILPSWFLWPSPKYLWVPVTLRIAYIPLILLANYRPEGLDRILPVVISNDWVYWFLMATMAVSSGYWSSVAMMYTPGTVEERHASTAGMFAGAALISGIFGGILLTFLWPWVISHIGY